MNTKKNGLPKDSEVNAVMVALAIDGVVALDTTVEFAGLFAVFNAPRKVGKTKNAIIAQIGNAIKKLVKPSGKTEW